MSLSRAQALREAFDRSFALPAIGRGERTEDVIAIRVGEERYAFRLVQIAGLFVDRKVTALPQPAPHLLGIAGFRGAIVPVYDLRTILGASNGAAPLRWLAIAAELPIAFAFAGFEGHLRLPRDEVAAAPGGHFVRDSIGTGEERRPVIHLPAVLEMLRREIHG